MPLNSDVISAGIGAFGSLASTGLGALMSNAASGKAFGRQLYAMQEQARLNYKYGLKSLENSPTSQRKGLESAGYNPMLAVSNATAGANSGWTGSGSAPMDEYAGNATAIGTNASNLANAYSMAKQTESNVETNESTQDLNYANADKAKAEKNSILEKLPFISKREKAEIANVEKDSLKKEAEIHNIDETTRFIEKRFELDKMLGESGLAVQRHGINQAYNASTFATRTKAETERGMINTHNPFGLGSVTKYYEPDDILRMTHRSGKPVTDSNNRKYWHRY